MSRFIIVQQEKGGVGKTFLAIHLTTYLRKLGHKFRPVDFDFHSGLVSEVFPAPDSASVSPSPDLIMSGESLLPSLLERVSKGELFLVDCGANTGPAWATLFRELPHLLDDLKAAKVKTTLVVPVTGDALTRRRFEEYREEFPGATIIMVVVREFPEEQLDLPKHPADITIDLPLAPKNLFSTYRATKTPVDSIATSSDPKFGITRAFARGYLQRLHAQFDKISKHLTP